MDLLKELQSVSVERRIALVEEDMATGKDRYTICGLSSL